ncbi:MAG: DUF4835 family protein [Capnocytophaga sp.]|nr:DUF4835 family protein [Capnocytophaga sp.]
MKNSILSVWFVLASSFGFAQELACKVAINTQQVNQTNQKIFQTLEKSLQEFINQTQWTSIKTLPNERIDCSFVFTITKYENNDFQADIQIQSSRPVYGSAYQTTVLNHLEKGISFSYLENEPLFFNPNSFTSNLSSIIAYYAFIIIGLDADTFAENGGRPFFENAFSVVLNAQSSSDRAWTQTGENNRWQLATDMLEGFAPFHKTMYEYHRKGLDIMASDQKGGKENITNAILNLQQLKSGRINNFPISLFFNAKNDEIFQIFSSGKPTENIQKIKEVLDNLAPLYLEKWQKIK